MVAYLARRYFVNSVVFVLGLSALPLLFGEGIAVHGALFWGGIFGAGYTYRRFDRLALWPLYDNLRLPRFLLIGGCFGALQIANLTVLILR